MKKLVLCLATVATITALTTGCASTPLDYKTGTQVSQEQLSSFVAGKTKQSDVVASIGQPNRKEALNSKEVWYYDFTKVGALGGNVSEATVFEWDAKGNLLQSYKTGKAGKTGNALLDAANK